MFEGEGHIASRGPNDDDSDDTEETCDIPMIPPEVVEDMKREGTWPFSDDD